MIDFLERMASDGDVRLERLERIGYCPGPAPWHLRQAG